MTSPLRFDSAARETAPLNMTHSIVSIPALNAATLISPINPTSVVGCGLGFPLPSVRGRMAGWLLPVSDLRRTHVIAPT